MRMPRVRMLCLALSALGLMGAAPAGPERMVASLDLAGPFQARTPWRFTAMQGSAMPDPVGYDETVPGAIHLCVSMDGGRTCQPDLDHLLTLPAADDLYARPHFLQDARIVQPRAGEALLLVQVASLHAVNNDQRVAMSMLAYDRQKDSFVSVYAHRTGRNNNQDTRYIAEGPLKGAIITADPTQDAPFGFWIVVSRRVGAGSYQQVLRYRSATRYGDGNPLAVIDSDMPEIERQLGLWRPGMALPLPKGGCAHPHLVHQALWC